MTLRLGKPWRLIFVQMTGRYIYICHHEMLFSYLTHEPDVFIHGGGAELLAAKSCCVLVLSQSADAYDVVCNGCDTSCHECVFDESAVVPMCTQVMQNADSSGGASTLQTISINRGFWRATPDSEVVLACYNSEACLGGVTGVSEYCREGYEGPCEQWVHRV